MKYIIAYDIGTGGTKASLFDENGVSRASAFVPCETSYPKPDFREQRPDDWWNSVVVSTKKMLTKFPVNVKDIVSLAVSGHSLGVVPISKSGRLLAEYVPVWNDARADKEAAEFFKIIDEDEWYLTTGNGFPAPLYSIFKIMWYKNNIPELYENTAKFIGTKDYVNYRMTGKLCTDHSYASGSGAYSLKENAYVDSYISASGIDKQKLPDIYPSTHIIGTILPKVAKDLGLSPETTVACGGVDNSCMALGAACFNDGEAYTSLGTSGWVAVSAHQPIVNTKHRPYVFAHCVPGQYISSAAIFSAGSSFRWVRDTFCKDLIQAEKNGGLNAYAAMDIEAATSPIGANKLIFNPSLAGGSSLDKSPNIKGAFIGLDLMHTRTDIIRSALEGICMGMRIAMDALCENVTLAENMLLVGGGGKSQFWRKLFAAIYDKNIVETNIGEDAGSLGAAAVAAVGCGMWKDFDVLKSVHKTINVIKPDIQMVQKYQKLFPMFKKIADIQSDIGDMLAELTL